MSAAVRQVRPGRLGHACGVGYRMVDLEDAWVLRDWRHAWAERVLGNPGLPAIVRCGVVRVLVALTLLGVVAAGCGHPDRGTAAGTGPNQARPEQRYEITATVSETAAHGPQLCLAAGALAAGVGGGCGGPEIAGWN